MKPTLLILLLAMGLGGSGCYRFKGELPGVLRRVPPTEYQVVGEFEIRIERKWWLFGFAKIGHTDMRRAVREAVAEKGGDGAVNLVIVTSVDGKDILWSALLALALLGQSRHMEIRGQVIKFKQSDTGE